jgi:Glyoxalase/Bleomycin resistance protein/Dioxygenase superfamily
MSALLNGVFQLAYVTNDLDEAAACLRGRYGTGEFAFFRDLPGSVMEIGLAYAGDMMVELIEPKTGAPELYSRWIENREGLVVRHHHYGMLIDSADEWEAMRSAYVARGTEIALEGDVPEFLAYLYADTTADLGHYLEYVRLYGGGRAMFASVPGSPFAA